MERMTKADFWDPLQAEYPEEMGEFKDWIDEYKRRVNWTYLFNIQTVDGFGPGTGISTDLKFHDLPNAMQLGIFIQYTIEQGGESFFQPGAEMWTMAGMIQEVRQWFSDTHRLLNL